MDHSPPTPSFRAPSIFSSLVGNPQAKEVLSHLITEKAVPQTLLFYGPKGVGKGLFALKTAQSLLGTTKDHHPDLHILEPDPESEQHPVITIRQLISETSLPPYQSPCKVFIIHDADKMLPTSSNTLLKTLEEPPAGIQFILITSQLSSLLPTIISRCSKVPFYPIPDAELISFLNTPDAQKIALLSEGSIGEALARIAQKSPLLPIDKLLSSRTYTDLYRLLKEVPDDLSSSETDRLFEDLLFAIRQHDPLKLETALPLVAEGRTALLHHLKLKNVLERFFLAFLLSEEKERASTDNN
jgi:hypothetical protein